MTPDPQGAPEASARAYSSHLLHREVPEDYLREWTERVAAKQERGQSGTESLVVFRIGSEWLGLPSRIFDEIAEQCTLHTVPHRRGGVLFGLVNIRGELLLCASLGALLGVEKRTEPVTDKGRPWFRRLLVVNREGNRLSFPVDEVHGVFRYHPGELKAAPSTLAHAASHFTLGMLPWQDRTIGCLDDELLFYQLDKSFA